MKDLGPKHMGHKPPKKRRLWVPMVFSWWVFNPDEFICQIGNLPLGVILLIGVILLMEAILHHLGCIKPENNGIFTISTGAGVLSSTIFQEYHI